MVFSNKIFTVSLLLVTAFSATRAQNDLNLSLKGGPLNGALTFASKNITFSDNEGSNRQGNGSVAMAFSLPIGGPKFRMGAEVGLNTYTQLADLDLTFSPQTTLKYQGDYVINQAYFAAVPEFRPINWAFVQAGLAYAPDFDSQFTSGIRYSSSVSSESIAGFTYKRFNSFAYFVGVGVCPRLSGSLAFLAEARFSSSPASTDSPDQIAIGYRALGFNIGLMYRPKQ